MTRLGIGWLVVTALACGPGQAGIIEDLLARPGIQAMLARQSDVRSILARCADPYYQQRNAGACRQADEARRLASMPSELRMVMSRPQSAAALRELCLAVQGAPLQNSFLCAELYRAEWDFRQSADQQRPSPKEGQQIN